MLKIVSRNHYSSKLIIIIIIELLHLPVLNKNHFLTWCRKPQKKKEKKKTKISKPDRGSNRAGSAPCKLSLTNFPISKSRKKR